MRANGIPGREAAWQAVAHDQTRPGRRQRPRDLVGGGRVEDLAIRFERGRVVDVDATRGADLVRAQMATDAAIRRDRPGRRFVSHRRAGSCSATS